jgi:hypothetical protein
MAEEKVKSLKISGLFYYRPRGLCQGCGRDTEPVVEIRDAVGKVKTSLCSNCCQGIMAIHEGQDL